MRWRHGEIKPADTSPVGELREGLEGLIHLLEGELSRSQQELALAQDTLARAEKAEKIRRIP